MFNLFVVLDWTGKVLIRKEAELAMVVDFKLNIQ